MTGPATWLEGLGVPEGEVRAFARRRRPLLTGMGLATSERIVKLAQRWWPQNPEGTVTSDVAWGQWSADVERLGRWLDARLRERLLVATDQILEERESDVAPPGWETVGEGFRRRSVRVDPQRGDMLTVRHHHRWLDLLVVNLHYGRVRVSCADGRLPYDLDTPNAPGEREREFLHGTWIAWTQRHRVLRVNAPLAPGLPPFKAKMRHLRGLALEDARARKRQGD